MGVHWQTSCLDWAERIVKRESIIPKSVIYPDQAAEALDIFKSLPMTDIDGTPTFGDVCDEWVFDFVSAIFGAADPEQRIREIRTFFLLVAKKNGKSTIVAGIMLTALILNWRNYEEFRILAPTKEVAQNSFKPITSMIEYVPDLKIRFIVRKAVREVEDSANGAVLKVVAAAANTTTGGKSAFTLIDELHLFGKSTKAAAMLQEATGGIASKLHGFEIYISTQSDEPPSGVFKEKLEYARAVRDGKIEDLTFLPVLYEFPNSFLEDESYLEPENFYIANPNIGRSVKTEFLEGKLKEVRFNDQSLITWIAKHLNIQVGGNRRNDRWAGVEHWQKNKIAMTFDELLERCELIVLGIDGGGLDDLFSLAAVGREIGSGDWLSWGHSWAHHGLLTRRPIIASRLLDFEEAGELTLVSDQMEDLEAIVSIVERVDLTRKLFCVAVDASGLGSLIQDLAKINITPENNKLVAAPQGGRMMDAIKTAERKAATGQLKHDGNSLVSWAMHNLKIEGTATGIRATKQNAGDLKIDPAIALFNAVTVLLKNPIMGESDEGDINDYLDYIKQQAKAGA